MKTNKGLKIAIIILVILIILIIGVLTYGAMFTDMLKSKKEIFLTYLTDNVTNLSDFKDQNLNAYLEKQINTPYQNEGKIYIETESNGKETLDISFSGNADKANNYNYQELKLNYAENVSMDFNYLNNADYITIGVPEVLKKDIALKKDSTDELLNNLGVSDSESIQKLLDLSSKVNRQNLSENAELNEKYKNILVDSIQEEQITKIKTDDYMKYTLTLSQDEAKNIVITFLTTMKEDTELQNELQQNYNMTTEQLSDFKNNLQELINQIQESESDENEQIKISVCVKSKTLVQTEIEISTDKLTIHFEGTTLNIKAEEIENGETKTNAQISIAKVATEDSLTYHMEANVEDNVVSMQVAYNGLTGNQVQEKYKLSLNKDKLVLNFETGKKFKDSISQEEITEDHLILLNEQSSEELSNFFEQLISRIVMLHESKVEEAGLDKDPIETLVEDISNEMQGELSNEIDF